MPSSPRESCAVGTFRVWDGIIRMVRPVGVPLAQGIRAFCCGGVSCRGGMSGQMCGIVGIAYRQPDRPVCRDELRRMSDAIQHRGPDDEGLYLGGSVGLGMRRLSIIDLDGSR